MTKQEKLVLQSPAWQSLSNTAKLAYYNICYYSNDKFTLADSKHPLQIICPRTRLINHMSAQSWATATKRLQEVGLIYIIEQGGRNKHSVYALSSRWKRIKKKAGKKHQ